ncbi:hypothetical protein ONS95_002319 [Cadophora gregata]|uniref:uncharacterized protein n=1 Tax=Cadophora gregata TaxID=51156 RepID=UPI0026DBF2EC|nr:uncharacterized protein ONS95_002319 [Cadophora gregata]KAK0109638.1 hypothetical protein ONS95_002319 [Cadophora gregata]KAK0110731.1 hypothetical protein ONS96_002330 [Cadophora gregata f. sp. sojae]
MSSSGSRNSNVTTFGPKPTKACVNCRRQKMKCEVDPDRTSSCKRCRISQIPCIFKPRANAAAIPQELIVPSILRPLHEEGLDAAEPKLDPTTVLARLAAIEGLLGIVPSSQPVLDDDVSLQTPDTESESPFSGVWAAAAHLKLATRPPQSSRIWSRAVIKQLWLSFHKTMPGLHFLSKKKTSSTPTPLLLAAILYVSALHSPSPEFAALAPGFFVATCCAISELAVPIQAAPRAEQHDTNSEAAKLNTEQNAFQNVLGLILAGLISEAFIETTGLWISMGYRLTLDHCPVHIDERSHEWRGLFSGLQIIDLEHASLHMSCPILPKEAPLPSLRQLQSAAKDPFYSLTQMMHIGLSHFVGRGLPTIWSFISSDQVESTVRPPSAFTEADGKVIREWARQLDDWLVLWNKPNDADLDGLMVFRQYSLHRLFVLSIYHPARGFDLFANNVASVERHELLISARATLKLQNEDKGIWSNWDLVMITWAALLVLQGIEGGVGEPDDFILIQAHLNMLQYTHQPSPSLRHRLASRLESSLQNMHTPRPAPEPDAMLDDGVPNNVANDGWAIFDQRSMDLARQNLNLNPGLGLDGGGGGGLGGTSGDGSGNGNGGGMAGMGVGVGVGGNVSGGGIGGMQGGYDGGISGVGVGGQVAMGGYAGEQWMGGGNGEYSDAWQNTLFRLFGNVEEMPGGGGSGSGLL